MEGFDLEKWKSGDYDVVTGEGKIGRIICTDIKNERSIAVILPTLDNPDGIEEMRTYYANGSYYGYGQSELDLMLVKKQWQPKYGEQFYFIDGPKLHCWSGEYVNNEFDEGLMKQGNFFRTYEEAEVKLNKILEILNE